MIPAITRILAAATLTLCSCATDSQRQAALPSEPPQVNRANGPWEHRYRDDRNLVGVWIQQLPDNSFEAPSYEGKHPCMVYYIFADGRAHGFHYLPDGTIESQDWSQAPTWMLDHLDIVYRPATLKALIRRAETNEHDT